MDKSRHIHRLTAYQRAQLDNALKRAGWLHRFEREHAVVAYARGLRARRSE